MAPKDRTRVDFVAAVAEIAGKVCAVLDENPLRGAGTYPIVTVHRHHEVLRRAIEEYPGLLAIDANGRPDKLGFHHARHIGRSATALVRSFALSCDEMLSYEGGS